MTTVLLVVAALWGLTAAAALAATAGSVTGVIASTRSSTTMPRAGFAWFVLAVALFMAVSQLPSGLLARVQDAGPLLGAATAGAALIVTLCLVIQWRRGRRHRGAVGSASEPGGQVSSRL